VPKIKRAEALIASKHRNGYKSGRYRFQIIGLSVLTGAKDQTVMSMLLPRTVETAFAGLLEQDFGQS
jgi:hypothetical protein